VRIEVGPSELLAIEGETGGTLSASVEIGAVEVRLPATMVDAGKTGIAEYHLAGAGGEMRATQGCRALELRRLTLGGEPAVARHDGKVVASVEALDASPGFDLEPAAPGRVVIAPQGELSVRLGVAERELALSTAAGTRLETLPGSLRVLTGRLVLDGPGATSPIEVGEGRSLLRRHEPREDEAHPLLRFYESATPR